jgi:hypothetical protein
MIRKTITPPNIFIEPGTLLFGRSNREKFGAGATSMSALFKTKEPRMQWTHDFDTALQQARDKSQFVLLDIFNPG